jgi:hypothetical protein
MSKEGSSQKDQPVMESCRARWIIQGKIIGCMNMPVRGCTYALPFGDEYFCLHPLSSDIVYKTHDIDEKS